MDFAGFYGIIISTAAFFQDLTVVGWEEAPRLPRHVSVIQLRQTFGNLPNDFSGHSNSNLCILINQTHIFSYLQATFVASVGSATLTLLLCYSVV